VLYARLSRRGQAWIDLLGGVLLLLPFCVFAIWVSWGFVADSWADHERSNNVGGLVRYPLKTVVPLAFLLIALQGASEVVKRLAVVLGHDPDEVGVDEPREAA
jgi:TRAP-type mannitol/chloroaromatic compound transport system permease small subunit